ncbi:hypothetical protein IWQ61_007373 [Dispira simplex]|nr:hypothetical protein IWQ61_007373 [Dispira simplex]
MDNAHYVGYVEDDESVEAIMKKFEELERIQRKIASEKPASTPPAVADTTDIPVDIAPDLTPSHEETVDEPVDLPSGTIIVMGETSGSDSPPPLTQEQLEEVFRQTSGFTVKTATLDMDAYDDAEWWKVQMEDGDTTEFVEEDDYVAVDDSFWDEEFGAPPAVKKRGRRGAVKVEREPRRPRHDKESIIQRYRIMQVKLQDKHGNQFFIRKKVSTVDPSLPTYVRIPAVPIPSSWVFHIQRLIEQSTPPAASKYLETDNLLEFDLKSLGTSYQAIYADPPLVLPGESPSPNKITLDELAKLPLGDLTPNGFLFIWVEKEYLPDIVHMAMAWKFKYVENFCWIKKRVNNCIARQPSTYFCKSKLTLLIFRKEGEIDIRHQRSPDSVFDFIKPTESEALTERKPKFAYKVIETLLPGALPNETNPHPDRLLELWSRPEEKRHGWTSVCQRKQS